MSVKRIGIKDNHLEQQPNFTASRDSNGIWTLRATYKCKEEHALSLVPGNGSAYSTTFGLVTLTNATITEAPGDVSTVSLTFKGLENGDEGDGDPDGQNSTSTVTVDVEESPISWSRNYYDKVAVNVLDGIESGDIVIKDGKFEESDGTPIDFNEISQAWTVLGNLSVEDLTLECARKIQGGDTSVLTPTMTYTVSYPATIMPNPGQVGLIESNPPGDPPTLTKATWLYIGMTADKEGGSYRISKTYKSSYYESWDTDVYN